MRNGGLIRARNRDRVVRILKDVVLSTITEIVEVIVEWRRVDTLVHLRATVRTELLMFVGYVGTLTLFLSSWSQ